MAEEICRRLRMSNSDTEQILALVANHMRFADVEKMSASTLKRFFRLKRLTSISHCTAWIAWPAMAICRSTNLPGQHYEAAEPEQIRPAAVDYRR